MRALYLPKLETYLTRGLGNLSNPYRIQNMENMMRHDKKRLYFNTLKTNQPEFLLNTRQTHYVKNVLRLTHGTEIELFDGEGQWLIAALDLSQRKKVLATPILCYRLTH